MKHNKNASNGRSNKKNEKGAALVTVVILLGLLLVVSGAIVLVTVLSNSSTVDVVAEKQAFEAAEAGMQLTLNILRGNGTGTALSFKDAAVRVTSNKDDDSFPSARLSNWLSYTYPATLPERVALTSPYDPTTGLAFSVTVSAPDSVVNLVPTPNPNWIDGPVTRPSPEIKPVNPAWHPWHCGHCSWDYTHCSLYNPPNNGTFRSDGFGCRHRHCIPPPGWGQSNGGGYERLIVRVVGYGPHGAKKQLELMVQRSMMDYSPHSLLLMQGSPFGGDLTFSVAGTPKVTFDGGDENVAFGLTSANDQTVIQNVINQPDKITIIGKGDDFEVFDPKEIPAWLKTVDDTRKLVSDLEADAKARGRWFNTYPTNNDGTDSAPLLTFVRGDATINSDGAGVIVVTGTLNITTDRHFKGLILILGNGTLNITSGKSTIEGSIVLAKFSSSGAFQGPVVNMSGTPEVVFKHNETRVTSSLTTINMGIMAVRDN